MELKFTLPIDKTAPLETRVRPHHLSPARALRAESVGTVRVAPTPWPGSLSLGPGIAAPYEPLGLGPAEIMTRAVSESESVPSTNVTTSSPEPAAAGAFHGYSEPTRAGPGWPKPESHDSDSESGPRGLRVGGDLIERCTQRRDSEAPTASSSHWN